jgi:IS30 family transposase
MCIKIFSTAKIVINFDLYHHYWKKKTARGLVYSYADRTQNWLPVDGKTCTREKQAMLLSKVVVRQLFAYENTVHTITPDSGSEFAAHEYANGPIRQYIIKVTNFDLYTDNFIRLV